MHNNSTASSEQPVASYLSKLSHSFGGTVEKDIPEDVEWIDDAFYIMKSRFGMHISILREPPGQHFISGLEYDTVLSVTR